MNLKLEDLLLLDLDDLMAMIEDRTPVQSGGTPHVLLSNWPACPKGMWEVSIGGIAPTIRAETRKRACAQAILWLDENPKAGPEGFQARRMLVFREGRLV